MVERRIPKPVPKLPVRRHPWEKIRDHFVEEPGEGITLKELAEAYNVSYNSVREKSSQERWAARRTQYQLEVATKETKARMKLHLENAEKFDDQSLKAAQIGQSLIMGRMAQIAELFAATQAQHRTVVAKIQQGLPVQKEDRYSVVYSKEIIDLANALDRFQQVGRRALGTDIQKFDIEGDIKHQHNVEGHVSVSEEMGKNDPDRLVSVIDALQRAGLVQIAIDEEDDDEDIEDAEVVEEGDSA